MRLRYQHGFAICDQSLINKFDSLGSKFWKTLSWDINNVKLQNSLQKTKKIIGGSIIFSKLKD